MKIFWIQVITIVVLLACVIGFYYYVGTSDLPDWLKFVLLK